MDTVSARNFAGTNDPHAWIGLRFQSQPGGPPNDVLLHVNMLDPANILQQEAIGILGVNLIYAAFYELETKESFRAATNFAAISNTGSLIFTYTSRGFAIWDATGRLRCLKPGDSYYTMAISPDNHWLVAAPLIN